LNCFILVQALGAVTLLLFVISLQQRKKERFLALQTAGTLLYIAQYLLAGKAAGAAMFVVVAVRGLVFYGYRKKNSAPSPAVLVLLMAVLAGCAIFTWESPLSLIPLAATAAKTWGTWQDDMKWTRASSLFGQAIMVVYNLLAAMYTGALTEVCNTVSTLIAMWRYDVRKGSDAGASSTGGG